MMKPPLFSNNFCEDLLQWYRASAVPKKEEESKKCCIHWETVSLKEKQKKKRTENSSEKLELISYTSQGNAENGRGKAVAEIWNRVPDFWNIQI
jgi:hypothetical protein